MRRGRIITAVTAFAAAVAVGAPSALAATPQQIYQDYAKHGKLTGHYSRGDLERALHDAVIQGYKPATSVAPAIKKKISQPSSGVAGASLPAAKKQGALPFTGLDLALMTAGGAALIAAGTGMRALGRAKK